jgi:pyruvate/2-oxoglutarate dehydrogenase complex dihydrolipoamide acyltransferase (E2) component
MMNITVGSELWSSSMLPEGIVEKWFIANGALVGFGEPVAQVRIEDALHELLAPATGHLVIETDAKSLIEPGSVIGRISVSPAVIA